MAIRCGEKSTDKTLFFWICLRLTPAADNELCIKSFASTEPAASSVYIFQIMQTLAGNVRDFDIKIPFHFLLTFIRSR